MIYHESPPGCAAGRRWDKNVNNRVLTAGFVAAFQHVGKSQFTDILQETVNCCHSDTEAEPADSERPGYNL
ncbi:hypothetical protein LP7551_00478 [Roseibium album]|nr:hypothetical protein LP7551_00478 [Roseibium album]